MDTAGAASAAAPSSRAMRKYEQASTLDAVILIAMPVVIAVLCGVIAWYAMSMPAH